MNTSNIQEYIEQLENYLLMIETKLNSDPECIKQKESLATIDYMMSKCEETRFSAYLLSLVDSEDFINTYLPPTISFNDTDIHFCLINAMFESIISIRNGFKKIINLNEINVYKYFDIDLPDINDISVRNKIHHMGAKELNTKNPCRSYLRVDYFDRTKKDNWQLLTITSESMLSSIEQFLEKVLLILIKGER